MKHLLLFALVFSCLFRANAQTIAPANLLREDFQHTNLRLSTGKQHAPLIAPRGSLSDALDHAFDSVCALSPVKGFNAAVQLPDGSTWKRAYGVSGADPLTTDHLMGMGSITKSFTATALLMLVEDGLLSLDDSIGKFVGPYPNVPGNASIRQLLSHRTGISDYLNENPDMLTAWVTNLDSIWTAESILNNYVLSPNFPLDSSWSYSNTNFLLAGRIIEHLTGKTWYEVVRERILDPLGLTHTFAYPWELPGTQPFAHVWADVDGDSTVDDVQGAGLPLEGFFSMAGAAGCLLSTPEDIARFQERLHGGHLLKPATLAKMETDYINDPQYGLLYGLGTMSFIGLQPLKNWGHNGSIIYESMSLYFPDFKLSIAVQQNDDRTATLQEPIVDEVNVFITLLFTYLTYSPGTPTGEIALAGQPFVYPNPSAGVLTLQFPENAASGLPLPCVLTDASGRVVLEQTISDPLTKLETGHLKAGVYLLQIRQAGRVSCYKVIKE